MVVVVLVMVAGGTISIVASVSEYGDEARSAYTQAHGVRRAAQVLSADTAMAGKTPTSTGIVLLSEPFDGHGTTTVHVRSVPLYPGAAVTVLVDPQDPGYAELPGVPYTSNGWWVFLLLLGLALILIVPVGVGVEYLGTLRSRRRAIRFLVR